jgi:hypothetical protein
MSPGDETTTASINRPTLVAPVLALVSLAVSIQMAPYRLAGSDAGALLTAASRILRGGVFYRDIDSYPFPAAAYLLAFVMNLFGESVAVARGMAAVLFVVTVLSLYAIALRVLGPPRAAVFGASLLAFKLIAWPSFTAYYYWDLAFCLGCAASALLVRHRFERVTAGLVVAGLLAGLAVTAKQSLGIPLAGAALVVLALPHQVTGRRSRDPDRGRFSQIAAFALAASLPVLVMAAYFGAQGVLPRLVESGLLRPFSAYLPTSSTSFLEPLAWWRFGELRELSGLAYSTEPVWAMLTHRQLPFESLYPAFWTASELFSRLVYTSVPAVFAALGWRWWQHRRVPPSGDVDERETGLLVLGALAAAIFVSAFPRADFTHVISVYPVVLLLAFALWRPSARGRKIEAVVVIFALSGCVAVTIIQQGQLTHRISLPRASLWITPDKAWIESAARFVIDETPEGEPFFVYGHEAYYYFFADRYSPWAFSQLYPGQAGGDEGRALRDRLAADPPRIALRGATRFPRVTPIPEYLPVLDRFIRQHYVADDRVFERYPTPGARPRKRQLQMLRRQSAESGSAAASTSGSTSGSADGPSTYPSARN